MTRVFLALFIDMHDLMLAKEIINELLKIAKNKNLISVKSVSLEIGNVVHGDHAKNIDLNNFIFLLKSVTPKYSLNEAVFNIKEITGDNWKITQIEI